MKTAVKISLCAAFGSLALSGCSKQQPDTAATPVAAATVVVPKPAANDPDAQQSAFLAAAEPFENLTEQAATAAPLKLRALVSDAQKAATGITPGLAAPAKAALETHLSDIAAAQQKNDRTGIALAAVEGYRTLVESARDTGPVPLAVSLLDYSGFRYQADLADPSPRWDDAAKAVAFAEQQWAGISAKISDPALKSDFANSIARMKEATGAKDLKKAKVASTHELDLVDKLEEYFAKA